MSKSYPGNFITGNPVPLSQTSNNGIWDLKDKYHATTAGTWQEADGIYEIPRSLRFRAASDAYLSRTFASAGNRRIWTYSVWFKRCRTSGSGWDWLFNTNTNGGFLINFDSGYADGRHQLAFYDDAGNPSIGWAPSFRDPSAWYHLVLSVNTTKITPSERVTAYVNGAALSNPTVTTYPSLNFQTSFNNNVLHEIGRWTNGGGRNADGYMTEINFIDGQALDPSYFGYTDSITGIWQPKRYTGGYGNNGFYLPFSENSGLRGLGKNFAGSNYIGITDLSNAVWDGTVTKTSNNALAPNGTMTAATINATSIYQYFNTSNNFSVDIEPQ
jgi:hypothetical protein